MLIRRQKRDSEDRLLLGDNPTVMKMMPQPAARLASASKHGGCPAKRRAEKNLFRCFDKAFAAPLLLVVSKKKSGFG